jgi:DNA polymerase
MGEVRACHPWLDAELNLVRPQVIGCLGATAAQAILGNEFRLTKERGRRIELPSGGTAVATVHPSAILRAPSEQRDAEYLQFISDLKVIRGLMRA